jgi:hypothetical protein
MTARSSPRIIEPIGTLAKPSDTGYTLLLPNARPGVQRPEFAAWADQPWCRTVTICLMAGNLPAASQTPAVCPVLRFR